MLDEYSAPLVLDDFWDFFFAVTFQGGGGVFRRLVPWRSRRWRKGRNAVTFNVWSSPARLLCENVSACWCSMCFYMEPVTRALNCCSLSPILPPPSLASFVPPLRHGLAPSMACIHTPLYATSSMATIVSPRLLSRPGCPGGDCVPSSLLSSLLRRSCG